MSWMFLFQAYLDSHRAHRLCQTDNDFLFPCIRTYRGGLECVHCNTYVDSAPFSYRDLIRNALTVQKCQLSLCLCPFAFTKLPCKDLRTPCSAPQLNSFLVSTHCKHNSTQWSVSKVQSSEWLGTFFYVKLLIHLHKNWMCSYLLRKREGTRNIIHWRWRLSEHRWDQSEQRSQSERRKENKERKCDVRKN